MGEDQSQYTLSNQPEMGSSIDLPIPCSIIVGADLPADFDTQPSLAQLLYRAATHSSPATLTHLTVSGETIQTYADLWHSAHSVWQALHLAGLQPQDFVVLHCHHSQHFLTGLWACFLGGFIPVPIAVPTDYETDRSKASLLTYALTTLQPPLILTESALQSPLEQFCHHHQLPCPIRLLDQLATPALSGALTSSPPPPTDPATLSLLLFTSGSTGTPKGVQLSHYNILASIHGMITANQLDPTSVCLNWMPLEHVASLVMFHLTQVALGCPQIQVSNELILPDPLRWLDLIDRFRVTHTWAPNFAYGLICDRSDTVVARSWDLSCLRWMGNGAEAVVGRTTRRFLDLLRPQGLGDTVLSPGYGMSETCSGIVHSQQFSQQTNDQDSFVEVGTPIPGISLRIVNQQNQILPEGTIGRLQVQGATIMVGYYQRPDLDQQVFTADGWLDTGDLGYLRMGKLTITGRQKDEIVIHGVNYYGHEIEAAVEELDIIQVSFTAACAVRRSTDDTDRLAIFCVPVAMESISQPTALQQLVKAVRKQVREAIGVTPTYVIPVTATAIPKTNLGKIQRTQLAQQFASGEFDAMLQTVTIALTQVTGIDRPRSQREQQIAAIWRSVLGLETVGIHDHFFELGGTSLLLMQVLQRLQTEIDPAFTAVMLFQYPTIASLARCLEPTPLPQRDRSARSKPTAEQPEIAVIGMAGRFPGANSIEAFWQNLQAGVESIHGFSTAEIIASGVDPGLVNHPDYVKASPILDCDIAAFDADFFGYTPKEASLLDPQQRLLLECAWECLEDAGYDPLQNQNAIGLYAGASMNTYLLNHVYPNRDQLDEQDSLQVLTLSSFGGFQLTTANDKDYLTTRISYKLNLTGPSMNVQTACSTSLVAIHLARQSLLNGECEMALAGGVSVHTPQQVGHLYRDGMILTSDGHCRAFDAQASGTIFGSGVGLVLLKRLDRALADGDRIYAVIKGSAIGNDGSQKVGYFAPSAQGQATVTASALEIAEVPAETIGYVEAHGTGTILGDPIEIAGLAQAFRLSTAANQFCAIGSVKSNVGHLNIASGVVGFIKTVLCLYHQKIPPSLHFHNPNPQIQFEQTPFYVNTQLQDWQAQAYPRRAGVNSLGIGGTNAHVILEEAPPNSSPTDPRSPYLLPLAAKTPAALTEMVEHYLRGLAETPVSLADLCFTAQTGRSHFAHRQSWIASSPADLQHQLADWLQKANALPPDPVAPTPPPMAWLFTGQGSQYAGMGQQLYETCAVFRETIDRCDQILFPTFGRSILDILKQSDRLEETRFAQPALFAIEYGLAQFWQACGLEPRVMIGHSIGEYVAACLADVFSLEDALKLVVARGALMQALPSGSMASVMASESEVQAWIQAEQHALAIAAVNSDRHVVVSGTGDDVAEFLRQFGKRGIATQLLQVSHAFHSEMMRPMLADFAQLARTISYQLPQRSIISTVTGTLIDAEMSTPDYWVQQIVRPVRFGVALQRLAELSCTQLLECGAKPTLIRIAQHSGIGKTYLPSLHPDRSDWHSILTTLSALYTAGHPIHWQALHIGYSHQILSLPHYPFQRQRYWLDRPVVQPLPQASSLKSTPSSLELTTSSLKSHPLLGQRITSPATILFQTNIHSNLPNFLFDHCIDRQIWFPAAGYLEMLLTALRSIHQPTEQSAPIAFQSVHFPQPLLLSDQPITTQLIYRKADRQVQIYSLSDPDTDQWQLHCTAMVGGSTASEASQSASTQIDLDSHCQQFAQTRSALAHYQHCRNQGLNYGAAFQAIDQIWLSEQQAFARIQLPAPVQLAQVDYSIHPVLLDNACQVLVALIPDAIQPDPEATSTSSHRCLPIAVEQVSVIQFPDPTANCFWGAVQITQVTANLITAEIQLFDAAGSLLVQVHGFTLQRLASPATAPLAQPLPPSFAQTEVDSIDQFSEPLDGQNLDGQNLDGQNYLYNVVWKPQIPSTQRTPSGTAGTIWLIFADSSRLTPAIIDRIIVAQQIYHLIYPKSDSENHSLYPASDHMHWIDPADPTEFTRLLIELGQQGNLGGILYGWGLEAQWTEQTQVVTEPLQGLLHLVQALATVIFPKPPRCWLITAGAQTIDAPGASDSENRDLCDPFQSSLWGLIKTVRLEHPELSLYCLDFDPDILWNPAHPDQWTASVELIWEYLQSTNPPEAIGLRDRQIYLPRLVPHFAFQTHANLFAPSDSPDPTCSSLELTCLHPGDLNTLTWQPTSRRAPAAHEVEIRVQASGLNFRDLLNALGQVPGITHPLGLECAGEIVALGTAVCQFKLGDRVMAIAIGSFSQFVTVDAALVVPHPPHLTGLEAATLPTAFLTATYALRYLGQLQPGERVLIHAAAGGVGQAAIQIAQQIGAEILATASPGKWDWLKSQGITQIYNSRTTDFAAAIQAIGGVDVVLNCLTGDFIPQSLAVLRSGGRFLEIGKIGIWSAAQVATLRPDVSYHPIDLMTLTQTQPTQIQALLQQVRADLVSSMQPLPYQVFMPTQVVDAFRTMQQAKHRGKIVIAIEPPAPIRAEGCYIITGGTGGIGLQLVRWLIDQGATDLLLIGRQDRSSVQPLLELLQRQMGDRLKEGQVEYKITCQAVDVADFDQMLQIIPTDRPVRGIFHAAGQLDDGVLLHQTWQRFQTVMAAKVQGAWNLHRLTQKFALDQHLDHFVLFSSAASLIGSAGQSNYAAANAFLDGLAHYRRSIGLTGLSINWAAWQNTGMAKRSARLEQLPQNPRLPASSHLRAIPTSEALACLNSLLQRSLTASPLTQIGVLPIDSTWRPPASEFFAEITQSLDSFAGDHPQELWQPDRVNQADRSQLLPYLTQQVSRILGISTTMIDPQQGLAELGMDSLTVVEFRNTLQTQLGYRLPATLLFDYPTLDRLCQYLIEQSSQPSTSLSSQSASDLSSADLSANYPADLTAIDQLSEAEAEAMLLATLETLEQQADEEGE